MRFKIRRCPKCQEYTLKEECPKCGIPTLIGHPAKFSPDDKYLVYKVKALVSRKKS